VLRPHESRIARDDLTRGAARRLEEREVRLEVRIAEREPSVVSANAFRRGAASGASDSKMQWLAAAPRPTRPRSWCSCASPNRSACSISMTVAFGTSIPTSITVVATSTWTSPSRNARITLSRSSPPIRPCTRPTTSSGKTFFSRAAMVVAAFRSARSDVSITG